MNNRILFADTLPAKVLQHGKSKAEKKAVCTGESFVTYGQLADKINSAITSLSGLGCEKGDCVVLSAIASSDYIAAFLAIKAAGMVAVPVNKGASEAEITDIISRTESNVFLSDNVRYNIPQRKSLRALCSEKINTHLALPEAVGADDVTEILFTSGTTGKPKGAMLTQSEIKASIYNTSTGMNMDENDVILIPLPLNHSFGLRVMRSALFNGETLVLQNGFSFPKEMKNNIEKWKCNALVAVTSGFERIREQVGSEYVEFYKNLKYIEFSAGAVPADLRAKYIADLPDVRLYNTWGSTETGGALFIEFSSHKDKLDSAGHAINDIETYIVDDKGNYLPAGEFGRLAIKSSAVMKGYYKDDDLTSAFIHDGILYTNDLAKMDEDGFIYLNGRVDDIISVGGEKVSPVEIENIVSGLDSIKGVACIGVEDEKLGQMPVLFVVSNGTVDSRMIEERLRTFGNGYMIPKQIIQLPDLPRNYMGKLDRKELRKIYSEKHEAGKEKENTSHADDFLNLITSRRSVRAFIEKPVEKEILDKILLAGRMAPSGHNQQTWRFTVLRNKDNINELKETTGVVAKRCNTSYYGWNNPQVLVIVSNDKRNFTGSQDSSAAIENMLLASHAFGLGSCWLNSLLHISDENEIRDLLTKYGIPSTHIVYGIVALGYYEGTVKTPVKKENCIHYYD